MPHPTSTAASPPAVTPFPALVQIFELRHLHRRGGGHPFGMTATWRRQRVGVRGGGCGGVVLEGTPSRQSPQPLATCRGSVRMGRASRAPVAVRMCPVNGSRSRASPNIHRGFAASGDTFSGIRADLRAPASSQEGWRLRMTREDVILRRRSRRRIWAGERPRGKGNRGGRRGRPRWFQHRPQL